MGFRVHRSVFDLAVVLLLVVGTALPPGLRLYRTVASSRALLDKAAASQAMRDSHPPLFAALPAHLTSFPLDPWRVGIQVGHWKIEELPWELSRLRNSTGARWGSYREVDANLDIARRVVRYLEAAGISVDLLPATIPPGYRADAFISIHADGAYRTSVRGWKMSTPWRTSRASRMLLEAMMETYPQFTGLPEDRYGTTYNMRGYYAFSSHRTRYAISPTTPAVIVEAGFVTVAEDREILFGAPDTAARGISAGIVRYLSRFDPLDPAATVVHRYPVMRVAGQEAELTFHPEENGRVAANVAAGTLVRPVHRQDGWVEVIVRGDYRRFGWMREADLEVLGGSS